LRAIDRGIRGLCTRVKYVKRSSLMGKQSWNFTADHSFDITDVGAEMEIESGTVPEELAARIRPLLNEHTEEISVSFQCTGTYYPAKLYGPPEECYPEERDEDREITCILIGDHDLTKGQLFNDLADFLAEMVYEVDVDYEYDRDPEW
jgi:hypothetical protein